MFSPTLTKHCQGAKHSVKHLLNLIGPMTIKEIRVGDLVKSLKRQKF